MAFKMRWYSGRVVARSKTNSYKNMEKACIIAEAEAKRLASQAGTGRIYKRGNVTHRASAPGEPFATDTGVTKNKITHKIMDLGLIVKGQIGANLLHLVHLEYGTSKMEARPTLRPAIINKKKEIEKALGEKILR